MPNEITAEMLAREMCRIEGNDPDDMIADGTPAFLWHLKRAEVHLLATRAYAALQAQQRKFEPGAPVLDEAGKLRGFTAQPTGIEYLNNTVTSAAQPTEAPGRVRCWYVKALQSITLDEPGAFMLSRDGYAVTPGHFTPRHGGARMTDDDRVYSAIRAQDGITVKQLLETTGLGLDVVSPIVRRGFDTGKITTDANFKLHLKEAHE